MDKNQLSNDNCSKNFRLNNTPNCLCLTPIFRSSSCQSGASPSANVTVAISSNQEM